MPLNYKGTLIQLLGLPPEATDDEIVENADTAVRGAERLQSKLSECGAARKRLENDYKSLKDRHDVLLNAQVAQDMERFKAVLGTDEKEVAQWKADLMTNREATVARLEGLSKRMGFTPHKPLHNAATAGTPAPVTAAERGSEDAYVAARQRALDRVRNRQAKTFTMAYQEEIALIK